MRSVLPIVTGILYACTFAMAGESLPYYDIRLDVQGNPVPFVLNAKSTALSAQTSLRNREAESLVRSVPGLRIDTHEFFATPHSIGSTDRFLTPAVPANQPFSPRSVARQFISDHQPLFNLDPVEISNARIERDFVTQHNGVTHLTFQQQINGIDLFGCEVLANVSRRGELVNISSTMLARPQGNFPLPAATITPLQAIRAAAANIGVTITVDPTPLNQPEGITQKQTWNKTPDFRTDEAVTTELIYFPLTAGDIRPAWSLVLPEIGIGNTYEIMVDATNGQVLRRWNRLHFATTEPITLRVYTGDDPAPGTPGTSTPTGVQFPFVPRTLLTVNPADVSAYSPNGWMDDGTSTSAGNNVHAHLDTGNTNPNNTGAIAGSSFRTFDFPLEPLSPPYDITVAPSDANARNAAVTNLFYLCNVYHDRLYAMGFNEAAKNFQLNNFGLGGTGNDRVQADCQDGSGTNNANFNTTGPDGSTARMQMYLFTAPAPDRDGSLDSMIVYHEHSHGLSIRLSNGTVNGTQSGGMGEGWGDFFGVGLNAQPSDDPHGVFPMGPYATYQLGSSVNNYYFGIRRFPYSTDMNKNPETYADIDIAQQSYPPGVPISPLTGPVISASASEVHNVGEVWCNTLLECRATLWDQYGFSANQLMMQLVVDGLKLEVTNPNFLQARDGILQADLNNNGGANRCLLWKAFAKRGMGPLATSPSGSSSTGIVESYDLYQFTFPDGLPTQLSPDGPTTFHVNVAGLNAAIIPTDGTGTLYYSINGGAFNSAPMSSTGVNQYLASLPAGACFDSVRYYFGSDGCAGPASNPGNAPTTYYTATVFSSVNSPFTDTFETNLGWTVGAAGDNATTGIWTRVDPVGTAAQPENDHTSGAGVNCFVTGQGAVGGAVGTADVDGGQTTLTSPTLDLSALQDATIGYWRWYSNNQGGAPAADTFLVDVSTNNGGSWTSAEVVGPAGPDTIGGWIYHEFTLSGLGLTPTSTVKVRFIASDLATGSVVEAGVDDFGVFERICETPVKCLKGDVNVDTFVDGLDIARFLDILLNGGGSTTENCAGDVGPTLNQAIDETDVDNFTNCVLNGGCP
jgi:hypothetical protein